METRAVNIYQSRPPLEYAEDSEEDETSLQTCEVEYKQENRLFMTRILPESATEDLHAISMISQKLAEGAHRALETQKGVFTLPDCTKGFKSVVTPNSCLGNKSDIFHHNNKNNQLERRVWLSRDVS